MESFALDWSGKRVWVGQGKLEKGEVGFSRQESLLMIEEVREEKMESCREEGWVSNAVSMSSSKRCADIWSFIVST